jgi:hypothetical protein
MSSDVKEDIIVIGVDFGKPFRVCEFGLDLFILQKLDALLVLVETLEAKRKLAPLSVAMT